MPHRQSAPSLLGYGLYSVRRAAEIVRAHPAALRRWADGYRYRKRSGLRVDMPPLIIREVPSLHEEHLVTFKDLLELLFIQHFVHAGVSTQVVRSAARAARERLGVSHPFASQSFCTDGRAIFEDLHLHPDPDLGVTGGRLVREIRTGQGVIVGIMERYLRDHIVLDPGRCRYAPPEGMGRVILDPQRRFGRPCVAGTGLETAVLYQCAEAWGGAADVASWYEIPESTVHVAVAYESAIRNAA